MAAYVGVLEETERGHPQVARPLVAYYTQSHVGQRVTQLRTAVVRARARSASIRGWSPQDLDRRRGELELLAPTLQQRITIGRLSAVVPLGLLAVGAGANHVGWLNTHGVLVSWLLVAAVILVLVVDAYATWCFMRKWHIFRDHVRDWECEMFRRRLLSEEPEPRIAFHLWMLDLGVALICIVSIVLLFGGHVPDDAPSWAPGSGFTPLRALLYWLALAIIFSWRFHVLERRRAAT
jgi:hypothetical protein